MPEKPIIERTLAKHTFTTEERLAMSEELTSHMREIEVLEDQLTSIKSDYKSKLEREGLQCDALAQKLRDKYEMREARAEVRMGVPSPGRKSYYYAEPYPGHVVGEFIKEEQMTHSDLQRTLPLEDAPKEEPVGIAAATISCDEQSVTFGTPAAPVQQYDATDEGMVPVAENPGPLTMSIADRLHAAAAGKELPLVQVDYPPGYAASKYRGLFRKAAKKQGWPEAAIDLLDTIAGEAIIGETISEDAKRVLEVLQTHSEPVPEKPAGETAASEEVAP